MRSNSRCSGTLGLCAAVLISLLSTAQAEDQHDDAGRSPAAAPVLLSNGTYLTPTAAKGSVLLALNPGLKDAPNFIAGQPVSEALSPDRKTLAILTSGYNYVSDAKGALIAADSNEYVFIFDVSGGAAQQKQVLQVPNTYIGLTFTPKGDQLLASGGADDEVHVFALNSAGLWGESSISPIKLNHTSTLALATGPLAEGIAVTADSQTAVVTNRYNASLSLVNLANGTFVSEINLRPALPAVPTPATVVPGGEYPNSVAVVGNTKAFVSSERDREIVVVDLVHGVVTSRIKVAGNPNKMVLNKAQTRLFVAQDNSDQVAVIDTAAARVIDTIDTIAPAGLLGGKQKYHGASPNGLALSADERSLYVTNRGTNSLAVIENSPRGGHVVGLIPTGWYPSDVVEGPGKMLYVVHVKNVSGPNPGNCLGYQTFPCPVANSPVTFVPNEYVLNLEKGGLLSLPAPREEALERLTIQVAKNNNFLSAAKGEEAEVMAGLREKIKHVIYIVKENRTYDQILGDIGRGNSDPTLAEFPFHTTPNFHRLASQFVQFDSFFDAGGVSGTGWPWTVGGKESDASAKMLPVNYAGRGGSYDWEGTNSNINVGLDGVARLIANPLSANPKTGGPNYDVLPGTGNVAAPDGPDGEVQQGYLWDAALRGGLSVRNYGFFIDLIRYNPLVQKTPSLAFAYIPLERDPFTAKLNVAYAANPQLAPLTDPYFRGFDSAYPDFYREREWEREFQGFEANGQLPNLSLVRLMGDHTGAFGSAIDGVNTPELQVADNDYAVGRVVEAVAHSRYAKDTLIFIVEDDAQDGPDHVDAHRSTAFVVGPYVKQGALVSQHFTTVNMLRTITDVLGIDHLSVFDATQAPMASAFDLSQSEWTYTAEVSGLLKGAAVKLPIPASTKVAGAVRKPTHDSKYWAAKTRNMDFAEEDKLDVEDYNRILWKGLMGKKAYPAKRTGQDLSERQSGQEKVISAAKVSTNN